MSNLRNACTGLAPVHVYSKALSVVAGLVLAATPIASAEAKKPAPQPVAAAAVRLPSQSVADFYRARSGAPLWLTPKSGDAAQQLLTVLANARIDGLDPDKYHVSALHEAVARARSDPKAAQVADQQLSEAFAAYVSDLRKDPGIGIIYVEPQLKPRAPSPFAALLDAANAPSLAVYVGQIGWMHPVYGELRQALLSHGYASDHERELLTLNLERARVLPAGRNRYVVVNAAQQRLFMYENRQAVDSMRVVVGKPKYPTPLMTALIRFAALNPYWYVPPDLAAKRIAPNVLKRGLGYLDELGYQVMSDWVDNPNIIDPKTIDWKAVADGKTEVLIRQLPGPHNSMGRMKFMFPNSEGVYLHDNPERELFEQAARLYSGGCVRLEDAARLGRWMFGRELDWESATTEQRVPLNDPVPVYITYLTAMPDGGTIAYYDDVYGRDAARIASLGGGGDVASR
ncbi:L,D-transpeptidase family protein [Sphingomonas hankyongi]|uniref:L,D-transpeptidase family protein n=1 Tax=Sphingomonas hankyongi TaxID=2908209 RepID=A0ABT0RZR4_9SPHN|nr:L,D-transpeptidase family protein [Sphingomonas hankyongi]